MSRFHPSAIWGPSSAKEASHDPAPTPDSGDPPPQDAETTSAYDNSAGFVSSSSSDQELSPAGPCGGVENLFQPATGVAARTAFFLPLHYEANYRYPLVIWLHSDGFNEHQVTQVMPHISLRNYLAVGVRASCATDSAGHCYEWRTRPSAIHAAYENVLHAIAQAGEQFSVHPSRIVLAGYQSGGAMAMRIALRDPARFAGVVSLGARMPSGCRSLSNLAELRARRLPMLWQWATEKSSFDGRELDRDMRRAMIIRAQLEIRQYRDDDEMNTVALADIDDWIMNHVVSASVGRSQESWATSPTQFSSN
ncbi:MAG: alpha/beta hydrolase [Novipirellula sp. JB048]